jgi:DnaJ-class molecular chaperone
MTSVIRSKLQAYAAIGVKEDASDAEIQAAVKRLLQANHPDRPGGDIEVYFAVNNAKRFLQSVKPCDECGGDKFVKIRQGRATVTKPCGACT